MERFKNIDWFTPVEDAVDDVFISDERLERESVMYQMLNGCYADPLEDIDDEYEKVDLDLIRKLDPDLFLEEDTWKPKCDNGNQNQIEQKNKKTMDYTPGLRKRPFNFPRLSRLNKMQQATCLRALLRLTNNEKKALTNEERSDLEKYMELNEKVTEEHKEFLEFVKSKWDSKFDWKIKSIKFVIKKWRAKMNERLNELPNEYIEMINVPLSVAKTSALKDIKVKFISCLKEASLADVILPPLTKPCFLNINTDELLEQYSPSDPSYKRQHFKLPVSKDTYCENFAMNHKVDFVISSSGLKCLLNNIDPQYSNLWTIPVVVKSHDGRNVVYVDKRLPPLTATTLQKNTWVYKYVLKYLFVKGNSKRKVSQAEDESEKVENTDDEDFLSNLVIDENCSDLSENLLDSNKNSDGSANDKTDSTSDDSPSNVTYKLFTIGPCESLDYSKLMKEEIKEFHMLVRTKTDGAEIIGNDKMPVMLEPKMEHQLSLGAEAITLEEGINQWMSLIFRPNTSLARLRIETGTGELIQIDRPTTMSLSTRINMLYNIKVEDSLYVLYNIIRKLSTLTPGRYILRHVPQHGAFAYVYKNAEECSENICTSEKTCFNLLTNCWSQTFETATVTPWPLLDCMTTTPGLRLLNRMPAMFNPRTGSNRGPGRPKKHSASADEPEKKNPGRTLRRQKRRNLRKQQKGK